MVVVREPKVKILLSIHDGELHLRELLESIGAQTYRGWELLVVDDGSSDSGIELIREAALADRRIRIVEERPPAGALGPARSFMELLAHVDVDELFAFCDQDDVWFAHKLAWSVELLGRAGHPIAAIATDAIVTDEHLAPVAASALAAHGAGLEVPFGRLLLNNVAIGATMVGTGRLADVARTGGDGIEIRMHDWWCALVAAYAGSFELLAAPTMFWRRHDATVTGRRPGSAVGRVERRLETFAWSRTAAGALHERLAAVDAERAGIALAVAGTSPVPGPISLLRLRRRGVRAWSMRHDANILVASTLSRFGTHLRPEPH